MLRIRHFPVQIVPVHQNENVCEDPARIGRHLTNVVPVSSDQDEVRPVGKARRLSIRLNEALEILPLVRSRDCEDQGTVRSPQEAPEFLANGRRPPRQGWWGESAQVNARRDHLHPPGLVVVVAQVLLLHLLVRARRDQGCSLKRLLLRLDSAGEIVALLESVPVHAPRAESLLLHSTQGMAGEDEWDTEKLG